MTEKQIEQLRNLLADSSLADEVNQSTNDLDAKILTSAQERMTVLKKNTPRFFITKLSGVPFRSLATVSLAVALTTALFFSMSQMIVPNETAIPLESDFDNEREKFLARNALTKHTKVKNLVSRPEPSIAQQAPSKISRDRVLMQFDLPAVSHVLADIQADFGQGQAAAGNAIDVAMQEISSMIELETFDRARERYAKLLETCGPCALPLTLEALVVDSASTTTFDTG